MKQFATKTFLLWVFILTTLFSCRQAASSEQDIENVITDLTNKFAQLPKAKSNQADYYQLIRSVTNGKKKFEIQLRSTPDSLEDPQQIIVFINQLGQCYAIPFFSNTYRDYWDFQFDSPIPTIKRTNTTFAKEFMTALDTLHLNDTIGTASIVFNEMLFSLLHCVNLTESDSSKLFKLYLNDNHDIPEESLDSSYIRLRKNYQAVSSEWHQYGFISTYFAYLDEKNYRVYQFNNKQKSWRKKLNLTIKVYRQDCVNHLYTM